jgi:hypothetical protein
VIDYNDFPTLEGDEPQPPPKMNYWENKTQTKPKQQTAQKQQTQRTNVVQEEELTVATSAITTASAEAIASLEKQMGKQMDMMSRRLGNQEDAFKTMQQGISANMKEQAMANDSKQKQLDALALSVQSLVAAMDRNFGAGSNQGARQSTDRIMPVPTFTDETTNGQQADTRQSSEMGADTSHNDVEMAQELKIQEIRNEQERKRKLETQSPREINLPSDDEDLNSDDAEKDVTESVKKPAGRTPNQPMTPQANRRHNAETPTRSNESHQARAQDDAKEEVQKMMNYDDMVTDEEDKKDNGDNASIKSAWTSQSFASLDSNKSKNTTDSKKSAWSSKGSRGRKTKYGNVKRGSIRHQVQGRVQERKEEKRTSKSKEKPELITLRMTRNRSAGRGRGGGLIENRSARLNGLDETNTKEDEPETPTQLADTEQMKDADDQPDNQQKDQNQTGSGAPKEQGPAEE